MDNTMDPKKVRRSLYGLLFHKPLYEYARTLPEGKAVKILITGNDQVFIDVFRAVFWCGQMSAPYSLSVTLASDDPASQQSRLYDELPALNSGLVPADIRFVSISDVPDISAFSAVFVAETIPDKARAALDAAVLSLNAAASPKSRILIYLCAKTGSSSEELRLDNRWEADVCSFSTVWDMKEPERLAFNIDFAYMLGADEHTSRPSIDDFTGPDNQYNHDSSFAGAVHIPYKLQLCEEYSGGRADAYSVLSQAIDDHDNGRANSLYDLLLELEHRRWSAYMIAEGWRAPSGEELVQYAYTDGNDHRNKALKLHPCLCLGGDNGCMLYRHYGLWNDEKAQSILSVGEMMDFFSTDPSYSLLTELDAVSLVLHNIACERSKDALARFGDLFSFLRKLDPDSDTKVYDELFYSARKLRDDEPNSIKLYHDALGEAKKQAVTDGLEKEIGEIEKSLNILVIRNRKTDYFDIDSVMIDMLPFCTWYGRKYGTVITFSSGVPVEDIIVPTMVCADKAVFLCRRGASEQYKSAVRDYFRKSRGGYTRVLFKDIETPEVDSLVDIIDTAIEENPGAVINWTASDDASTSMAIGIAYNRPYMPVFKYIPGRGVVNIKDDTCISAGIGRKSLSVDEFAALMGGSYRNVYKNVGSIRDFDNFKKVFFKYLDEREYISNGKRTVRSLWNALSNVFQSSSKDYRLNLTDSRPLTAPQTYIGRFSTLLFDACGLRSFLSSLARYRIITDYSCKEENSRINVSFRYVDRELKDLIDSYSGQYVISYPDLVERSHRQPKLIPETGIVISSTQAKDVVFADRNESRKFISDKADFLYTLESLGLIKDLEIDGNSLRASFEFKNNRTMQLFKTQGKIFELVLYEQFRNSGLFDDVETGVQICWDMNAEKEDALVALRIQQSGGIGYGNYRKIRQAVREDINSGALDCGTVNEIDIVLSCGMTPVFISCKTGKSGENDWLNEISSLAGHFYARPVLAVTKDLDLQRAKSFLARARKMGVSVIGSETFLNEERMFNAMMAIRAGKTVLGSQIVE